MTNRYAVLAGRLQEAERRLARAHRAGERGRVCAIEQTIRSLTLEMLEIEAEQRAESRRAA